MSSLREIQLRANSLKTTEKITTVMKMIAITKYRKFSRIFPKANAFVQQFQQMKKYIEPTSQGTQKYLLTFPPERGLCSSLNTKFDRFLKENYKDYSIITIKQADPVSIEFFEDITKKIVDFAEVKIAYVRFESTSRHIITEETLFPWKHDQSHDFYTINEIQDIEKWLQNYLTLSLYNALLNTQTSENAARMLAMDSASKNATEIIQNLKLSYNKKRQEMITREITETGCSVYGE